MPDVSPDDAKLNFTVADFKEDYWPRLSEPDKKLVELFFLRYDHRNLLAWLAAGDGAAFDERAMFHLLNLAREDAASILITARAAPSRSRSIPTTRPTSCAT